MSNTVIVPGSYDPVTLGHIDIIRRAAAMFDTVYASVMVNSEKHGLFTPDERLELLKSACRDMKNVKCLVWTSLTAELLEHTGAHIIVKGIRNATDFDYENSIAEIMRRFTPGTETVFLPARPEYYHISSTYARERLKYGSELSDIADAETARLMRTIYDNKSLK